MPVKRFVTRRVEVDAIRFTGSNFDELADWSGEFIQNCGPEKDEWPGRVYDKLHDTWINVAAGQWIVRGAKGEHYPCDDETFMWKYEPTPEQRIKDLMEVHKELTEEKLRMMEEEN